MKLPQGLAQDFFDEEVRLGYRISKEMKEVWAVSIDMALKFIDVCKRHGLQCWMDSGTLLGAVRHQGFIPWDDDIDFVMLRKDYDKLVKVVSKEFQPPYFFQTTLTDVDTFSGQAQIRRMDTASLSKPELNRTYCRGINMDIFVLDGFIENPVLRWFHRSIAMAMKKTMQASLRKWSEMRLSKRWVWVLAKCIYSIVPYESAFRGYEKWFRMIDADTHKRVSVCAYKYSTHRRVRNRDSYRTMVPMAFENLLMPAPNDTDDALRCYFGADYMTPVKAPSMHGHKYMDVHHDYIEATKMIKENPELLEEQIKKLYSE